MADPLFSLTKFINSPPGQVVAGGALAGIVWKAFDKLEAVASANDKIQVWIWLAEPQTATQVEHWPQTFCSLFDRAFGVKHLGWKCFLRSCIVSFLLTSFSVVLFSKGVWPFNRPPRVVWTIVGAMLLTNVFPDYLSLLETRYVLKLMSAQRSIILWIGALLGDACVTLVIAVVGVWLGNALFEFYIGAPSRSFLSFITVPYRLVLATLHLQNSNDGLMAMLVYPAFFTSFWFWIYALSGFLLKGARRFDKSLAWLNRRLDIENHPLSSIGYVAGLLTVLVYWGAVIVSRVM